MKVTSRIGQKLKDGGILSIYHNNGDYEWLINILNTHYTDAETVAELIVGGDVLSCWVDNKPKYYESRPPIYDTNIFSFLSNHAEEFSYVFDDGIWTCFDTRPSSKNYAGKVTTTVKSSSNNIKKLLIGLTKMSHINN